MSRILGILALAALVLAGCSSVADAQVVRDNSVRMAVERVDGNRQPVSPDMTMYSNSDTFNLYVTDGDSVSAHIDTVGIVGPLAWAILEFEEQANATKVWYQAKELEDGARDIPDTTQSYAWGNWTCILVNGVAGSVPLNSVGLIDSIRFKCYGTTSACYLPCNLRQELYAPTWRASDAAVD